MAQLRSPAILESSREPHSVSLKVLRLSRPSLSIQQPLPASSPPVLSAASYAYPVQNTYNDGFILSPLLILPPAFGYAYVGETFSCTLCANNEILPRSTAAKTINAVRIEAEMKTPSSTTPTKLALHGVETSTPEAEKIEDTVGNGLAPGQSRQKILQFELKEEGSHVLAVSVTYSELSATSGRVRTFRKLYQFACKNCLVIRSKVTSLQASPAKRWALEAQLENCGEETIILEKVMLDTQEGFESKSLNWDILDPESLMGNPKLMPGDVQQVCFLVQETEKQSIIDGKVILGAISVSWRGAMGNKGYMSTNPLETKFT